VFRRYDIVSTADFRDGAREFDVADGKRKRP